MRPPRFGKDDLVVWRLDKSIYKESWANGGGAFQFGGRWNNKGVRAVYCSLDPSTAILEVAVHTGFETLDTMAYTLTAITISKQEKIHVVMPQEIPDPDWLKPGNPSDGQQAFGDALLRDNRFVIFPSVVSTHSWNLVFNASHAKGHFAVKHQERFVLDPRLHA